LGPLASPKPTSPLETARAIETVVADLRAPVKELYRTRRQHPRPLKKAIAGLEDVFADLDDELRDALEDSADLRRFDQLDDVEDELRKILDRNRDLQAARSGVRLSPDEIARCNRVDAAVGRLARIYDSWGR
jgi:chromosome segregation ATPase